MTELEALGDWVSSIALSLREADITWYIKTTTLNK